MKSIAILELYTTSMFPSLCSSQIPFSIVYFKQTTVLWFSNENMNTYRTWRTLMRFVEP